MPDVVAYGDGDEAGDGAGYGAGDIISLLMGLACLMRLNVDVLPVVMGSVGEQRNTRSL